MATVALKRLAKIHTGFTIRESVSYLTHGDTKLLQVKDLPDQDGLIKASDLTRIDWKYDSQPQYLKQGAIVLLARGMPKAYRFEGTLDDKVIVGHVFIVITLTTDLFNPTYLAWYINQASTAQQHFEKHSTGSVLNMTSITTVRELPIVIPSLQAQQQILKRRQQAIDERQAFERLRLLREEYNHALNETLLNQYRHPDSK